MYERISGIFASPPQTLQPGGEWPCPPVATETLRVINVLSGPPHPVRPRLESVWRVGSGPEQSGPGVGRPTMGTYHCGTSPVPPATCVTDRVRVRADGARRGPAYHLRPRGWSSTARSRPEHESGLVAEPRAATRPTHRTGNAWSSDPPMEISMAPAQGSHAQMEKWDPFLIKCIARRCFLTCLRDRHNRDRNHPRSAVTVPELLFPPFLLHYIANVRWAARDPASRTGSGITCVLLHPAWAPEWSSGFRTAPARHSGSCKGTWKLCGVLNLVRRFPHPHATPDRLRAPDPACNSRPHAGCGGDLWGGACVGGASPWDSRCERTGNPKGAGIGWPNAESNAGSGISLESVVL